MHRLRPCDEDEDGAANPDDMVEDEDVYVTKDMLEEVLDTRIGGKARQNNDTDEIGNEVPCLASGSCCHFPSFYSLALCIDIQIYIFMCENGVSI